MVLIVIKELTSLADTSPNSKLPLATYGKYDDGERRERRGVCSLVRLLVDVRHKVC